MGPLECSEDGFGIQVLEALRPFAEPAQDLRGDHARIAARAHEGALHDGTPRILPICARGQRAQVLDDALYGEGHVGASIPIRHREYVETVDLFLALGERG